MIQLGKKINLKNDNNMGIQLSITALNKIMNVQMKKRKKPWTINVMCQALSKQYRIITIDEDRKDCSVHRCLDESH